MESLWQKMADIQSHKRGAKRQSSLVPAQHCAINMAKFAYCGELVTNFFLKERVVKGSQFISIPISVYLSVYPSIGFLVFIISHSLFFLIHVITSIRPCDSIVKQMAVRESDLLSGHLNHAAVIQSQFEFIFQMKGKRDRLHPSLCARESTDPSDGA